MTIVEPRVVPTRLAEIHAEYEPTSQRPARWSERAWRAALPKFGELFDRLPNPIDRDAVRSEVPIVDDESDAVRLFITAMVWGFGPVGYGPYRTARVLTENLGAGEKLLVAARRVQQEGGPSAFAWMRHNRLPWLGVSFATKYLYFCNGSSAEPALILDQLVRRWLAEHAGQRIRMDWHVGDYERYIRMAVGWADQLGAAPDEIEYMMFADELAHGSRFQRLSARAQAADPLAEAPIDAGSASEGQDVLDALDEAAEAFAGMAGGMDRYELEDFERGLRQLRRIVLARVAIA